MFLQLTNRSAVSARRPRDSLSEADVQRRQWTPLDRFNRWRRQRQHLELNSAQLSFSICRAERNDATRLSITAPATISGEMDQTGDVQSPEVTARSRALSTLSSSILSCRRKLPFFIEPILVMYFFCEFPIDAINQRYTLDWIGKNLIPKDGDNATSASEKNESTCSINSSAMANR